MDVEKAKSIVAQHLMDLNYDEVEIEFFGGEPFLEFETIKIVCEWVWQQNWPLKYVFFATTNGTVLDESIKSWLRIHRKEFWVSLSLDGSKIYHDINRSNSFDSIDLYFYKTCWPEQSVKMTISEATIGHIYENIVYIHSLGYRIAGSNFAEGIDWSDRKYLDIVSEQLEKLCDYYIKHPEIEPAPILKLPLHKCAEEHTDSFKWCGCGEYMAAYDTDGKKYPCTFFTPMTFSQEILSALSSIDFTDKTCFIDKECHQNCYIAPICNSCYGANMLANGVLNKRDRSKCELMKIRALYSAALIANKWKDGCEDNYENSMTAKAILRINQLYNK